MRRHAKAPSVGPTKEAAASFGALFALAVLLLLGAAVNASAAPTALSAYAHLVDFGEAQITRSSSSQPGGVAVDPATGDILVADEYGGDIDVFAPDSALGGTPLTSFSAGCGLPRSLAIDPGNGDLYVKCGQFNEPVLQRFVSDGAPIPTYSLDPSFAPAALDDYNGGLAVDPTTHDLLVTELSTGRVVRLAPSGEFLSSFKGADSPRALSLPQGIAVGPDGSIYVNYNSEGRPSVQRFDSSGTWLSSFSLAVEPLTLNLAVDPVSGRVIVYNSGFLQGFTPSGESLYSVGAIPGHEEQYYAPAAGVAIDGNSGRLYVYLQEELFGIHTFIPATYPGADAPAVSNLTTTSAHVSAEVDAGAGPPAESNAHFEYSGDGGVTWSSLPDQEDTGPPVEADITGLSPNVDYLVRVVAKNSQLSHTSDPTPFTTVGVVPDAATGSATDIGETGAGLNGTINPIGLQTTFRFEYGLNTDYGNRVPVAIEAVAGKGRADRIYSRTIAGLEPGTTYHYRLVATNSIGAADGGDRTFTTRAAGERPQRGYEQVTPVDKQGGVPDNRLGYQARADGNAFSYVSRPTGAGLESAPWMARSVSLRGSADWASGIEADAPLGVQLNFAMQSALGISDDFTHAFVVSDRVLAPGAAEGGANLYVRDLREDSYALVGSTTERGALSPFVSLQTANKFIGGAPDYSWIVFASRAPLLPGVTGQQLYRWSESGGLQLVSVLPGGATPANAEVELSPSAGWVRSTSADGGRAYFVLRGEGEGIYLNENEQTRAISASQVPGDPTTPQPGRFLGTGEDGRYAYFYDEGAPLTSDAPGLPGDVYRYDADSGELKYLGATASQADLAPLAVSDDGRTAYFWATDGIDVWHDEMLHNVSGTQLRLGNGFASPSGRYFAYGIEGGDVYLYDAETQQLSCASCLSDGSSGGGNLPLSERFVSNRTPQAVDDSGQVFFDSKARLVAADVNGEKDVYQYQNGRASLISPGNAPFEASFADMSEDGSDVFFVTNQKLVGRDHDRSPDIYDARIGGGLAAQSPPPPQECIRDDCKGTPGQGPELPFGGSEALSGPGNVNTAARKRCPKGRKARQVKGKSRCVKQSKKKDKQAKSNRRQAR